MRGTRVVALTAIMATGCMPLHGGGMGGMGGMGRSTDTVMQGESCEPATRAVEEHLRAMEGNGVYGADSMRVVLAAHRGRLDAMLAACGNEVAARRQAPDPEWTSTVAALRRDLDVLTHVEGAAVTAFLREHRGRIARFIELQRKLAASGDA